MKHILLPGILLMAVIAVTACNVGPSADLSAERSPSFTFSVEELREDFEQFRRIAGRKTAQLYTDRAELEESLREAEEVIEGPMTELEFCRLLAPAVADLRCGHSFISVSAGLEKYLQTKAHFFPLQVRIFGERLVVISDPYKTGIESGTEIVGINGEGTGAIIDTIYGSVPTDGNDTGRLKYDTEKWFASLYYTYIGTPDTFSLEVLRPETETSAIVEVSAVRDASLAKTAQGVMHDTANTPWSVSYEDDYALCTIPTFNYSDRDGYAEFLQNTFSEIKERNLEMLILDLRGNYGGTPFPTVELFKYLIPEPLPFFSDENPFYLNRWKKPVMPAENAFNGDLYVLMDEAGFSMNGFLLSLLKYHDIGTLVGSETSGGYKCSDASRTVTLRNTGLRFRYSTAVFQTAVEGFKAGTGIEPDIYVNRTVADYVNGNDPVLDAALLSAGL